MYFHIFSALCLHAFSWQQSVKVSPPPPSLRALSLVHSVNWSVCVCHGKMLTEEKIGHSFMAEVWSKLQRFMYGMQVEMARVNWASLSLLLVKGGEGVQSLERMTWALTASSIFSSIPWPREMCYPRLSLSTFSPPPVRIFCIRIDWTFEFCDKYRTAQLPCESTYSL